MLDIKKLLTKILQQVKTNQTNISARLPMSYFKGGYESVGTISANSYKDVTINHNLGVTPTVIATLYSSGTASNIGSVCVAVADVTTTQAKIRVFNNRSATISPAIEWLAIHK